MYTHLFGFVIFLSTTVPGSRLWVCKQSFVKNCVSLYWLTIINARDGFSL